MSAGNRWQLQWVAPFTILIGSIMIWLADFRPALASSGAADFQEIADGVYVRAGRTALLFDADNVANTGFIIGTRCVAVIDTGGSVAEGRAIDDAIRKLTELPVCFVINTHVHPDHILGNKAFDRENVTFAGHAKLPRAMALRGDTYLERAAEHSGEAADASQIVLPERTVEGEVQLDLGARILILRAHATAHTDNDLTVFDERTATLFLGDLAFLEHLPVLDGSINGWLGELDTLMRRKAERVVPGHGPTHAGWPAAGEPTVDYLRDLRAATLEWIANGGELGEAQEAIKVNHPERWRLVEEYHKRNIGAAFAELEWED
ncbi:MAG: quinoprotein relay system zinc metallohydrolase 2 [Woeseiaceae bacterium]